MPLPNKANDEVSDSGHDAGPTASAEDLLDHLEGISGRTFYTTQDVNAWLAGVRDSAQQEITANKSRKRMLLLIGLLAAFLQYEIIDMMIQVNSLRGSGVTAPASRPAAYRS